VRIRHLGWGGAFVATSLVMAGMTAPPIQAARSETVLHREAMWAYRPIPRFTHVFYFMMENTSANMLIGNPNAPFINQLVRQYGYDTNYYGVTHTSLPNYVAALSGSNWFSNEDDVTQRFSHTNLVDQLMARHLSWQGVMENIPYPGFAGAWYPDNEPAGTSPNTQPPNALYAIKHDPFLLFSDIANNPAATRNVVPLREFAQELATGQVARFTWISPNLINDMHGQPSGPGATVTYADETELIRDGDAFLKQWVTAIMHSPAWTGNSVIFITWDEAEYPYPTNVPWSTLAPFTAPGPDAPVLPPGDWAGYQWPGGPFGGGNVPLIVISRLNPHPLTISTWADHYSLLQTIEEGFGLPYLGAATDTAEVTPLDAFFRPTTPGERIAAASEPSAATEVPVSAAVPLTFTFRMPGGAPLRDAAVQLTQKGLAYAEFGTSPNPAEDTMTNAAALGTLRTNNQGQVTVYVTDNNLNDYGVVTAAADGAMLDSGPVTVVAGAPAAATSSAPGATAVPANQAAELTFTFEDAAGNPIPDAPVTFTQSGLASATFGTGSTAAQDTLASASQLTGVFTNGFGQVTIGLTDPVAGDAGTVTASIPGLSLTSGPVTIVANTAP
jgi:hypothetical protein